MGDKQEKVTFDKGFALVDTFGSGPSLKIHTHKGDILFCWSDQFGPIPEKKNGAVLDPDPQMMGSSGKEPLDRAALGAIHASSPFEPLPSAFSGPFIELRFYFLYCGNQPCPIPGN